jgi:hypothetical protein
MVEPLSSPERLEHPLAMVWLRQEQGEPPVPCLWETGRIELPSSLEAV